MQLHILRGRQLLQSTRVGHHLINHHVAGGEGLGRIRLLGFVYCTVRVLLARCTTAWVGAEMPLVTLAAFDRDTGLRLGIGIAMDHRPRRILQRKRLTRVDHVRREALQADLHRLIGHTHLPTFSIKHRIATRRKLSLGQFDGGLVIHERPPGEVDLMLGGVTQLHVLRGRQLLQPPRVGHHLINYDIAGREGLWSIGLLGFVYGTVRILLARCAAAWVRTEVPLVAFATLYRYAGLSLRVGVCVDHRPCRILQRKRLTRIDHVGRETLQANFHRLIGHTHLPTFSIEHRIATRRKLHFGQFDGGLIIHERPPV